MSWQGCPLARSKAAVRALYHRLFLDVRGFFLFVFWLLLRFANVDTTGSSSAKKRSAHRRQEMTVPRHGVLGESLFAPRALKKRLRYFGLGNLGDRLALARPSPDRKSFENIVIDLAGSGSISVVAELTT
jgi:hypothetical protein